MADVSVVQQDFPDDTISIARLHGEACIACGTTRAPLAPAGHVYTRDQQGGRLGWSVVACAEHQVRP